jgi:hypothetical protein
VASTPPPKTPFCTSARTVVQVLARFLTRRKLRHSEVLALEFSSAGNTFSQVAFDFRVTRGLLAQGLGWALLIGAAGGLLPAIRAARLPVTEGLRTL